MKQEDLAREAEMMQPRISAMERPGAKFSLETLVRLAAALRFASISEMLKWENEFSQDTFNVTEIDDDVEFQKEETEQTAAPTSTEETKAANTFLRTGTAMRVGGSASMEFWRSFASNKTTFGQRTVGVGVSAGHATVTGIGRSIGPADKGAAQALPLQSTAGEGILRGLANSLLLRPEPSGSPPTAH